MWSASYPRSFPCYSFHEVYPCYCACSIWIFLFLVQMSSRHWTALGQHSGNLNEWSVSKMQAYCGFWRMMEHRSSATCQPPSNFLAQTPRPQPGKSQVSPPAKNLPSAVVQPIEGTNKNIFLSIFLFLTIILSTRTLILDKTENNSDWPVTKSI